MDGSRQVSMVYFWSARIGSIFLLPSKEPWIPTLIPASLASWRQPIQRQAVSSTSSILLLYTVVVESSGSLARSPAADLGHYGSACLIYFTSIRALSVLTLKVLLLCPMRCFLSSEGVNSLVLVWLINPAPARVHTIRPSTDAHASSRIVPGFFHLLYLVSPIATMWTSYT